MTQTTLKIDGMMCGMCESHINDAIRKEFPVKMLICGKEAKANRQQSLLFRSKRNMVEMFISLCYTIIKI